MKGNSLPFDPETGEIRSWGTKLSGVSPLSDIEARMGIFPPLEALHAERDDLVRQAATLRAKHGAGGTWDNHRKIQLATIAMSLRAQALRDQVKMTESHIDDAAHADPRYVEAVTQATTERADLTILENRIQGINETINRQQALCRFISAETFLTPKNG